MEVNVYIPGVSKKLTEESVSNLEKAGVENLVVYDALSRVGLFPEKPKDKLKALTTEYSRIRTYRNTFLDDVDVRRIFNLDAEDFMDLHINLIAQSGACDFALILKEARSHSVLPKINKVILISPNFKKSAKKERKQIRVVNKEINKFYQSYRKNKEPNLKLNLDTLRRYRTLNKIKEEREGLLRIPPATLADNPTFIIRSTGDKFSSRANFGYIEERSIEAEFLEVDCNWHNPLAGPGGAYVAKRIAKFLK